MTAKSKILRVAGVATVAVIVAGSFAVGRLTSDNDMVGTTATSTPTTPPSDTVSHSPDRGPEVDAARLEVISGDLSDLPPPESGGDFAEAFDGNVGIDRFRRGVYHRDVDAFGFPMDSPGERTWTGDHDLSCGSPDTQRVIDKVDRDAAFYACKDHLMTSVGAVDSYSLAWFSPNQTFTAADTTVVSWDVNVTNLLARQWWEVILVDPSEPDLIAHPTVAGIDGNAEVGLPQMIPYPEGSVAVGNGPFAPGPIKINGENQGWEPVCTTEYALDPEGCASKPIRRTFTLTDNRDGTVTVDFLDNSWTVAGAFPEEFKVVFKDHNYTPDKDGIPVGHTWHWDNIMVS